MKKFYSSFIIVLSLFYASLLSANHLSQDKVYLLNHKELLYLKNKKSINVCNLKDLRPFEFYENNRVQGLSIDILKKVETFLDINFNIVLAENLQDAKRLLEEKKCDIISASANKSIFTKNIFTHDYLNYKLAIITNNDKNIANTLEELNDKKIALLKDSPFIKILKQNNPNLEVLTTNSLKETFDAINDNKAYYTLKPVVLASYYMSKYNLDNIHITGYSNLYSGISMVLREDDTLLLNILNKSLNSISLQEHKEIFNKWTYIPVKKVYDFFYFWLALLFALIVISIIAYRHYLLKMHNNALQEANKKIEEKTQELNKQKRLFETLYNKSTDGVLLIEGEELIDCNEATSNILKLSKKSLLQSKIYDLAPMFQENGQSSKEMFDLMLEKAKKKGSVKFEWLFIIEQEKQLYVEIVFTAIELENKSLVHSLIRDINQRKILEKQLEDLNLNLQDRINKEILKNEEHTKRLIQQSRLAQMGEMISMIAHQWRQPLTAISATTNNLLLKMIIDQDINKDYFKKELDLITEYSQLLSLTIDEFRNFFKTNKQKNNFQVEEVINKSINIIKTSLKENNINVKTKFQANITINSYLIELQQVILNILKNSEDILIEKNSNDRDIFIETQLLKIENETYVQVLISDNGGGIKEDIIEKIFDPYFSTKNEKNGTGLGLYMSKMIITDHCQGTLKVHNKENGAVFTVTLPSKIKELENA